jgi:hypothetical protein
MTESMADFLNLHPNLNTRTRRLMAETRDLKVCSPANHPVSGLPLLDCIPNRQPLSANRHYPHQTKDPGEPGSCSSL